MELENTLIRSIKKREERKWFSLHSMCAVCPQSGGFVAGQLSADPCWTVGDGRLDRILHDPFSVPPSSRGINLSRNSLARSQKGKKIFKSPSSIFLPVGTEPSICSTHCWQSGQVSCYLEKWLLDMIVWLLSWTWTVFLFQWSSGKIFIWGINFVQLYSTNYGGLVE